MAEWPVALTFLVVALFYFLAPVVGYGNDSRKSLEIPLWMLIGVLALAVLVDFLGCVTDTTTKGIRIPVIILEEGGYVAALALCLNGLKLVRKQS